MTRKPDTLPATEDRLPTRSGRRVRRLSVVYGPSASFEPYGRFIEPDRSAVIIGRDPGEGGLEIDDPQASRKHVELELVSGAGQYRANDRGSRNQTYLDGVPLSEPDYLHDGAVLRVGKSLVVFEELEDPRPYVDLRACPADRGLGAHAAETIADRARQSPMPVLIVGPTGAGKERIARLIHGTSRPFIPINCATLSKELASAELFGHVKGAFANAHRDRKGIFVEAGDGTVFLDEVGELPSEVQAMLLRALQEKRVRPVGADREVPVPARVLAATHRPLAALEASGAFRADLLARLSGVVITLPGLSARRVEILPLLRRFFGSAVDVAPDAAEALLTYDWPKNIRELEQMVAGIQLLSRQPVKRLQLEHLPASLTAAAPELATGRVDGRPSSEQLISLLTLHGGNVSAIARELGVFRTQVNRWLDYYKLKAVKFRSPKGPSE